MKTSKQIQRARARIEATIKRQHEALEALRAECTHPNMIVTHGGDTGNYDRSANCYWTDYRCPDCDFRDRKYKS